MGPTAGSGRDGAEDDTKALRTRLLEQGRGQPGRAPLRDSARPPAFLVAVLLGAALAAPETAQAFNGSPLSFSDAYREVSAHGTSFCPGCGPNGEDEVFSNGDTLTDDHLYFFEATANSVGSTAYMSSVIGSSKLTGEGWIDLGFTGDNEASTLFSVTFQGGGNVPTNAIEVGFQTTGGAVNELYLELTSATSGQILFVDGLATPGFHIEPFVLEKDVDHTLVVKASGYDGSGQPSSANWRFAFTPEPGTGLLLGGGLVALAARRRSGRG